MERPFLPDSMQSTLSRLRARASSESPESSPHAQRQLTVKSILSMQTATPLTP